MSLKIENRVFARDGTSLFYQDWGTGRPLVFLSAWTFNSDVWGTHVHAAVQRGFRCIAPDRRGHGRSAIARSGYDIDTLTDDLTCLLEHLDVKDAVLVAHSMGSVEAVRYVAQDINGRIARLLLVSPVTPFLPLTADNLSGIPTELIELQYGAIAADFPKWIGENEAPFVTEDTDPETRLWLKMMMLSVPLPVALACRKTLSYADVRLNAQQVMRPTLIIHGDMDASAPLQVTAKKTAELILGSRLEVYEGAPHALPLTHRHRFLADLFAFAS